MLDFGQQSLTFYMPDTQAAEVFCRGYRRCEMGKSILTTSSSNVSNAAIFFGAVDIKTATLLQRKASY